MSARAFVVLATVLVCVSGCGDGGGTPPQPSVSITMAPGTASIVTGAVQQFAASVAGTSDTAVVWQIQEGPAGGSISDQGVYTAPAAPGEYHVVATSHADPSVTATVVVTVTRNVSVTLTPASASPSVGKTVAFSAQVAGTSNTGVTWSVQEGPAGGAITDQGVYTAPMARGDFHVVAASQEDPAKSATAVVHVQATTLGVAIE